MNLVDLNDILAAKDSILELEPDLDQESLIQRLIDATGADRDNVLRAFRKQDKPKKKFI